MAELKIKDIPVRIKEFVTAMPKKRKILIGAIGGGVILLALLLTVFLNMGNSGYRVLYANMESAEASSVYQTLTDMGVKVQMNDKGEVMVPKGQYDALLLQLASKGYPQTALAYDVFSSNSGMTTTESERKQWLIYQLQDRVQDTLKLISGVVGSTVTFNIPESTDYIWQQATNAEKSSASVLLTLQPGTTLNTEQVTSIKKLVAKGVPKLDPADVTVVDSKTSLELYGESDQQNTGSLTSNQNLEFEQMVQKQIENNITKVLAPRYGSDGVTASAKVTINYDKMITERLQLQEKPTDANGNGGGGFPTHVEGEYTVNGKDTVGGIVGEENNNDLPSYGYKNPANPEDVSQYKGSTDYDYSYIKTQIEKGNAILERATVSVMVNEPSLTQARKEELTSLISRSADIDPDLISVSSFTPADENPAPGVSGDGLSFLADLPLWVYAALGALLILIIGLVVFIVLARRRHKRIARANAQLQEEEAARLAAMEIDEYKKQLSEAAKAGSSAKDDAIMTEVRDFAKTNPEVTANLLRSWLKEGE